MQIDPLLSIFVSFADPEINLPALEPVLHFLDESVPHHIDYLKVGGRPGSDQRVSIGARLHVWKMTPGHRR